MSYMTRIANDDQGVLELVAEVFEGGLELHLGDGNTFAEHAGCGVVVLDQVELETQEGQSVVLTSIGLETLKAFGGASVDLGKELPAITWDAAFTSSIRFRRTAQRHSGSC